jgi:hypothetical protein
MGAIAAHIITGLKTALADSESNSIGKFPDGTFSWCWSESLRDENIAAIWTLAG